MTEPSAYTQAQVLDAIWGTYRATKPDPVAPHECFDLDGTRVHGDPSMGEESRRAIQKVIAAVEADFWQV